MRGSMLLACAAAAAAAAFFAFLPRGDWREGFDSGALPYGVFPVRDALTPGECRALMGAARASLQPSKVVNRDPTGGDDRDVLDPVRSSYQAWLYESDQAVGGIVKKLLATAASLTGVRRADLMEAVMVARYEPGQKYDAHHDACTVGCEKAPVYRRATLLVYLNDDFEGGTTTFPKIPLTVRPETGQGVLFYNTEPETGAVIPESLHSGDPVVRGQKFIATVWIKFPPALHGFHAAAA